MFYINEDFTIFMIVKDAVYGIQKITDKCVIEIIKTGAFQRLKGIKQSGIISYVHPRHKITRYEHCLGVYFLLKMFKASREEQIAGLLHDLPHTAFSHVADFVFGNGTDNYHEKLHEKMLVESEIPRILKKYGFDVKKFLHEDNFKLLEQPLPDLCADRMDYFLRDSLELRMDFRKYLKNIKLYKGKFVFDNEDAALHYSLGYKNMNEISWENPYKNSLYVVAADIVKKALKQGVIIESDFLKTDDEVLNKIKKSENVELRSYLASLQEFTKEDDCSSNYCFKIDLRGRYLDPFVIKGKGLKRLSEINKSYSSLIKCYKEWVKHGYEVSVKRI